DWRNNVPRRDRFEPRNRRYVFDWPFLEQQDREHSLVRLMPLLWYSEPAARTCAAVDCHYSAVTAALRARSRYLEGVDSYDLGLGFTFGHITAGASHLNAWARIDNPYYAGSARPQMGAGLDLAFLEGIGLFALRRSWNVSPFTLARGPRIELSTHIGGAYPTDRFVLPEQWSNNQVTEIGGGGSVR